jgi:hypothetical protein
MNPAKAMTIRSSDMKYSFLSEQGLTNVQCFSGWKAANPKANPHFNTTTMPLRGIYQSQERSP